MYREGHSKYGNAENYGHHNHTCQRRLHDLNDVLQSNAPFFDIAGALCRSSMASGWRRCGVEKKVRRAKRRRTRRADVTTSGNNGGHAATSNDGGDDASDGANRRLVSTMPASISGPVCERFR